MSKARLRISVKFGETKLLVPCGDGAITVDELIEKAIGRYKKHKKMVRNEWMSVCRITYNWCVSWTCLISLFSLITDYILHCILTYFGGYYNFLMHRTTWLIIIIIFFCYYSMKKMKLFLKVYFKKTGMLAMVKIVLLISLTTKKWWVSEWMRGWMDEWISEFDQQWLYKLVRVYSNIIIIGLFCYFVIWTCWQKSLSKYSIQNYVYWTSTALRE